MAVRFRIAGKDEVLRNLNRQVLGIKKRTRKGMLAAGLLVKGESMRLTPVDTGNLRNSAYTDPIGTDDNPGVEIGYQAAYAVYVHERTELHHEVGQAKFLETALKKSARRVLSIIRRAAKV